MLKKIVTIMTTPIYLSAIQELVFKPKEPIKLSTLLENISPDIDNKILDVSKNQNLNPIGGEVLIYMKDDDNVMVEWSFYFNSKENTTQELTKISSQKFIANEYIVNDDILSIKENKILKFAIEPPSELN